MVISLPPKLKVCESEDNTQRLCKKTTRATSVKSIEPKFGGERHAPPVVRCPTHDTFETYPLVLSLKMLIKAS
jgi:hypothetical protein